MYSYKNREDLEPLKELISLEGQVKALRLQEKLGKQNFHEDMKKVFEPVPKCNKDVFEEVTRTMAETSIKNYKALENLSEKFLELGNDKGIVA